MGFRCYFLSPKKFWTEKTKQNKIPPGTVACAVILATGTVEIGCLRW